MTSKMGMGFIFFLFFLSNIILTLSIEYTIQIGLIYIKRVYFYIGPFVHTVIQNFRPDNHLNCCWCDKFDDTYIEE